MWYHNVMGETKIILDTNVLYAGLFSSTGASYQILRAIERGQIQIVLSTTLLFEYEEILFRKKQAFAFAYLRDMDEVPVQWENADPIRQTCTLRHKPKECTWDWPDRLPTFCAASKCGCQPFGLSDRNHIPTLHQGADRAKEPIRDSG